MFVSLFLSLSLSPPERNVYRQDRDDLPRVDRAEFENEINSLRVRGCDENFRWQNPSDALPSLSLFPKSTPAELNGRDASLLFAAVVENKTLERSCVTIYRPAAYPFYFRIGQQNTHTCIRANA